MADGIGLRKTTKDRDPKAVQGILESLPGWFGDPDAINNYVAAAADELYTSVLARGDGSVLGVALGDRHLPESAELHLIAVAPHARGRGVRRELVEHVARDLAADGCCFLSVTQSGLPSRTSPMRTHVPSTGRWRSHLSKNIRVWSEARSDAHPCAPAIAVGCSAAGEVRHQGEVAR